MGKIKDLAKDKIIIIDGATGTQIQGFNLIASDFGGDSFEGCNENLNIYRPDVIKEIHKRYIDAGADIIKTNSFGSSSLVLSEYNLQDKSYELSKKAAELAKEAISEFSKREVFAAGSIGPTTKMINVTGGISFNELKDVYKEQIRGVLDGGADLILFETFTDSSNLKAGILALKELDKEKNCETEFMISVTIERNGTMLAGQEISALYHSVVHFNPVSIGINCGLGPSQVAVHIENLSKISNVCVSVHPNAGLPDENGNYTEDPEIFSNKLFELVSSGNLNIVGGCCGTSPAHIKKLSEKISSLSPRRLSNINTSVVTGMETLEITDEVRPLMVGERTNMSGSKKFRKLIRDQKFDVAAEIAKKQVLKGAQIIDINLADTESDEIFNIDNFYPQVVKKIKVPVMVDTTGQADVVDKALSYLQGKGIINSVNLEDVRRFHEIAEIAKKHGAMIMALLISEEKMATTLEDKLETADRIYKMLTEEHKISPANIIFDCLVFPLGSGDENYYQAAKNTIESITLIKEKYPEVKFSLGISNCSFGLPEAGREALNSAYLYYATKAGLDMAIVNSEKIVRYASLSDEEKQLCKDMLFDNSPENVNKFIAYYSGREAKNKNIEISSLPLNERLKNYLVEGIKDGLESDLKLALEEKAPLDIINQDLMEGMAIVGKKFNDNELTVIEVLQSAEVMKSAVDFLKSFMSKESNVSKGKILLATVKGDVHDIGKNLVDIVLSNNGYEVIDLGIKIEKERIAEGVRKHNPDAIGLSGLLVKSAMEMIETAKYLKEQGIDLPIYVGGAALSKKFAGLKIQPMYEGSVIYGQDAVKSLDLFNHYFDKETRDNFLSEIRSDYRSLENPGIGQVKSQVNEMKVSELEIIPQNPEIVEYVENYKIDEVIPYINWQMLIGKHLGLKGIVKKEILDETSKISKMKKDIDVIINELSSKDLFEFKAVYKFFESTKNEKNEIRILSESFSFPVSKENLSISSYLKAKDVISMFCVTSGSKILEYAKKLKSEGNYVKFHIVNSLALELAEAMAELIHHKIRKLWNIDTEIPMNEILQGKYRGKRYSFGYAACPDLNDQEKLFKLLNVTEKIGVKLSEGMMMEPEGSVSGIVIHHPEAKYFVVEES